MNYSDLTHISGPAIVEFDSVVWYSEGDISISIEQKTFDISSSRFGVIGRRIASLPVGKISFKPDGQVTTAKVNAAFPYSATSVGKTIFGDTDKPCTIKTLAGQKYTFPRAGMSGSPTLKLSAINTAFDGNVEITCLGARGSDPEDENSFLKIEAVPFADASFDESKIITPGFTASYGSDPLDAIESLDGFSITCATQTAEKSVDRFGVIDVLLTAIGPATCEFTPAGLSEADWLSLANIDGASVRMPGVPSSTGTDLVITGGNLVVSLPKCQISGLGLAFGANADRLGKITFFNSTKFTAGVPAKPISITVS